MTGLFSFLSEAFKFFNLLFGEFLNRSNANAQAQKQYQVDTAEFQAIASSVLTRLRAKAAADSQQAQTVEQQADASLQEREKNP